MPDCPVLTAACSNRYAQVTTVPTSVLKVTRGILKANAWAKDAADRLVSAA
jgi:hypothetical protein